MSNFKDTVKEIQIVVKQHEEYVSYENFNIYKNELQMDIWFRLNWESYYSHQFSTDVAFYLKNDLVFNPKKFKKYFLEVIHRYSTENNPKDEKGFKIYNGSHEYIIEGKLIYLTPYIIDRIINKEWEYPQMIS